jgi:hypothetical protein
MDTSAAKGFQLSGKVVLLAVDQAEKGGGHVPSPRAFITYTHLGYQPAPPTTRMDTHTWTFNQ